MYVLGFDQWNPAAPWVVLDRTKNKAIEHHPEKEPAEARCLELNRGLPPQPKPKPPAVRFHTVASMRKELTWLSQSMRDALMLGSEDRRRRRIEAETGIRQPTKMMPEELSTKTNTFTAGASLLDEKNAALLDALSRLSPEKWTDVFRDLPAPPPEAPDDPAAYRAGFRKLRESYGISREDLAGASGVDKKTIRRIEGGKSFRLKSLWAMERGLKTLIREVSIEKSPKYPH